MMEEERPGRGIAGWRSDDPGTETLNRGIAGWRSSGPRAGDDASAYGKAAPAGEKGTRSEDGYAETDHVFPPNERRILQRDSALERANAVRLARAQLKRDVAAGAIELDIVLGHPPDCCAKMAVFDVLQWRPGIGTSSARRLIRGLLSETLPLTAMSARTCDQLVRRLHARARRQAQGREHAEVT